MSNGQLCLFWPQLFYEFMAQDGKFLNMAWWELILALWRQHLNSTVNMEIFLLWSIFEPRKEGLKQCKGKFAWKALRWLGLFVSSEWWKWLRRGTENLREANPEHSQRGNMVWSEGVWQLSAGTAAFPILWPSKDGIFPSHTSRVAPSRFLTGFCLTHEQREEELT